MSCFVIAEAGVNHNGDMALALELVDRAAQAGADAVKFQTFRADTLVTREAPTVEYQRRHTGAPDQLGMLRALELSEEAHHALAERCAARGIEFMSTAFDIDSARLLVSLGIRRIKVPSGELTNHPLLRELAAFGLPMIVSTGMATLPEVGEAVKVIRDATSGAELPLTLLHCTSNYPTAPEDVNLRAMRTLGDEFGVPVGYSDHTSGITVPIAAAALGATVIEKHFTLDRTMPGPDHQASLEPAELADMVRAIREVGRALGSGDKAPRPAEADVRDAVRRSVVLRRALPAGARIERDDLVLLRPGTGLPPADVDRVVGMRVRQALPDGHLLAWDDLER